MFLLDAFLHSGISMNPQSRKTVVPSHAFSFCTFAGTRHVPPQQPQQLCAFFCIPDLYHPLHHALVHGLLCLTVAADHQRFWESLPSRKAKHSTLKVLPNTVFQERNDSSGFRSDMGLESWSWDMDLNQALVLVVCLSQVHWFLATGGSLRGRHLSHNAQWIFFGEGV